MLTTTPRPKTCRCCKAKFTPVRPMQVACGVLCGLEIGRKKAQAEREKAEKVSLKQRKEKAKTNGQRKAEAQAAINRWVVHVRDADLPCISCGRFHQGAWHAGHYRSRGSAPHLALDPRNLAKQCAPCNMHLHGNLIAFRLGLIARYGISHVEALEADNEPRHFNGADYDAIKADYRARFRSLTPPGEAA